MIYLNTKIHQEFKGQINNVIFTNKTHYLMTKKFLKMLGKQIENKHKRVYFENNFIKDFKKALENNDKNQHTSTKELDEQLTYEITHTSSIETLQLGNFNPAFEKLNQNLQNQKYLFHVKP